MEPREAVERLTGRIYKHHLRVTGRLPEEKTTRAIEKKAQLVAQRVERKNLKGR